MFINTDGMFRVEAPANLILTLQSMPPFFIENIFALTLVVLLTVPLIAHIQIFLKNVRKVTTRQEASSRRKYCYDTEQRHQYGNRTVVMHYPAPVKLDSSSNSDLDIQLTSMRTTCSTPTVKSSVEKLKINISNENQNSRQEQNYQQIFRDIFLTNQKTCLPLDRSSSFLATNAQLPIIDISAFDYDSYRHKLIGISLKRQYGDRQAPGDVVLNSIHLNSVGSQSGIKLSENYSHSLFDFIEEYYDITKSMSKKEKEYLHPLDHFLIKSGEKPKTANTGTETRNYSVQDSDQVPEIVSRRNESLTSSSPSAAPQSPITPFEKSILPKTAKDAVSRLALKSRGSSRITCHATSPKTPKLPNSPKSPKSPTTVKPSVTINTNRNNSLTLTPATQQLFSRTNKLDSTAKLCSSALVVDPTEDRSNKPKKAFLTSRTWRIRTASASESLSPTPIETLESSKIPEFINNENFPIVREKSSNDSIATPQRMLKSIKNREAALSTDQDDKESITCGSASSSELESCSNSSKPRDKRFVRSGNLTSFSRSRTIGIPNPTNQLCVSGNRIGLLDNSNNKMLKKSSEKAMRPKLNVRQKSTVGRFSWDVPDVPQVTSCDEKLIEEIPADVPAITKRPRTTDTSLSNKRRNFNYEKHAKLSDDIVLPVLESFVHPQVNNSIDINNEHKCQENVGIIKTSSELRESKRTIKPLRHRKVCNEQSFVRSLPSRQITVEKTVLGRKFSKNNSAESPIIGMKSSLVTKTLTDHPESVDKLRINSGVENLTNDTNRQISIGDKTECYLDKTQRRTRRLTTSPLIRKTNLRTPEVSQLTHGKNVIAKVCTKPPESDVSRLAHPQTT